MSNFSSRMIAQVVIEFDTGSEYGGKWTFEDAYKDALHAAQNMCAEISREQGVKVLRIESIRSHVIERKS
ncbi:hypothetical protein PQR71_12845 [Paraburkholderia fungorum]|uniref:hypothetical protein n=1 Tax=Paraburkholderia fungorum TaxID=134537 RepID=UPI0038BA8A5F